MSGKARSNRGTVEAIVFRCIRAHAPIKPCEVADKLGMTHMAVWKTVWRLRQRGAIERTDKAYMVAVGKQAPCDNRGRKEASRRNLSLKHRRRGLAKYVRPPERVVPKTELERVWPLVREATNAAA